MKKPVVAAVLGSAIGLIAISAHSQSASTRLVSTDAPAGTYRLDHSHADLTFRLSHLGFSMYTARFAKFDAQLQFDPVDPQRTTFAATIDANSLVLPAPPEGFTKTLLGPEWLDTAKHPQISFRSSKVEVTGPNSARVLGTLTLHGATKPITLHATFNGGYSGHPMDPNGRIGFSAKGSFKRSDFGIAYGIPAPGTTMGVGDEIEVIIEAEFTGPPKA